MFINNRELFSEIFFIYYQRLTTITATCKSRKISRILICFEAVNVIFLEIVLIWEVKIEKSYYHLEDLPT